MQSGIFFGAVCPPLEGAGGGSWGEALFVLHLV